MKRIAWKRPVVLGLLLAVLIVTTGREATCEENLLLFDSDSKQVASYHIGDWTQSVQFVNGWYDIAYETYPSGPTGTPVTNVSAVPQETSSFATPNELKGAYPSTSGLPEVTLYGFGQATRDHTDLLKPGIRFIPSSGTYERTIAITLQASPGTALVEYRYEGEIPWRQTGQNTIGLYAYKTTTIEMRAVDGGHYSDVKTARYVISQQNVSNPEMADTDGDGYPDSWEIAGALNPLERDTGKDSDGDGFSDADELLRGTDPGDSDSVPEDQDHDGWSDFDEELRGTEVQDEMDKPVARSLYEVERLLGGAFYQDNDASIFISEIPYRITSLGSDVLVENVADSSGSFEHRIPVDEPGLIRGTEEPHQNFVVKRYIPLTKDPSPADVTGEWTTAAEWEGLYIQLLRDTLVEDVPGFQVTPVHAYPITLLERELEILAGKDGTYFLEGSLSYPANGNALNQLNDGVLVSRGQNMNHHLADIDSLLDEAQICSNFLLDSDDIYANCSEQDAQTVEIQLAAFYQNSLGRYLAGLMLAYSYAEMSGMNDPFCDILDPTGDLDTDGLVNAGEVPTVSVPEGASDPFDSDSDDDGYSDDLDNCPKTHNPEQSDWDEDGLGDACDPDDDDDGLTDGQEAVFGSDPFKTDTDGDGETDYEEYEEYQDPGVVISIDPVITPTNINSQTVTGTMEEDATVVITVDTAATPGPVTYPMATMWHCTITGLVEGQNGITATASDGQGGTGEETATIVLDTIPPAVSISSPLSDPTGDNTPLLSFTVDFGTVQVKVDGVTVEKYSGDELDALSDGAHTVRVESTDDAGNIGYDEVSFTVVTVYSNLIRVPDDYVTIQEAVNNADHGTRILVEASTYNENIDFLGLAILLISESGPDATVIEGDGTGPVITFSSGETELSILDGFTIQQGQAAQGGGIYCSNASPTIRNNRVINNLATTASDGGGIYCGDDTGPVIVNNLIAANQATDHGGGIYVGQNAHPTILNNTMDGNSALEGGGIYCDSNATPLIENNIVTNSSDGGGIHAEADAAPSCDYNNVWNNTDGNYSLPSLQGAHDLSGNPLFVDAQIGNYRLQANSPCIDMGNDAVLGLPNTDQDGKPRVMDGDDDDILTVDMGAYEFGYICYGDLDVDGDVDGLDLSLFDLDMPDVTLEDMAIDYGKINCP